MNTLLRMIGDGLILLAVMGLLLALITGIEALR